MVKRVERAMHPLDSEPPATQRKQAPQGHRYKTPHPIENKALALAMVQSGASSPQASSMTGIPPSTIRTWVARFELMGDSELESYIDSKKRAMGGVWVEMEEQALELAMEMRQERNAKAFQAAMTAAGIAHDKTKGMGQPKIITSYASDENKSLLDAFQEPAEPQSGEKPHDNDANDAT